MIPFFLIITRSMSYFLNITSILGTVEILKHIFLQTKMLATSVEKVGHAFLQSQNLVL